MALPNEPITRQEMYLSNIAGQNTALPDAPITREEMYLDYIAKTGGTGEGDMKKSVYDSDNSVASAGGIKMFVNQKIGTIPQKVGTLETKVSVLEGEVASIEDNLGNLGTASTKNSTSVVTESTDLVESGAVKDIVGWGNKNICNVDNAIKATNLVSANNDGIITFKDVTSAQWSTTYIGYFDMVSGKEYVISTSDLEPLTYGRIGFSKNPTSVPSSSSTPDITTDPGINAEHIIEYNKYKNNFIANETARVYLFYCNDSSSTSHAEFSKGFMIRLASDTSDTYEPYHASVEETIPQVVSDAVGWDVGNLITGVVENYSIIADGTVTADNAFMYTDGSVVKPYHNYRFKAQSTDTATANVRIHGYNSSGAWVKQIAYVGATTTADMKFYVDDPSIVSVKISLKKAFTKYTLTYFTVDESKADTSVIAPTENNSTTSQAYAVGSHAIRNGAFITWKNAKAQGEPINDASDYTSGDVAKALNNIRDVRIGTFSFANGVSPAGTVQFDKPFDDDVDADKMVVFITSVSGNASYSYAPQASDFTKTGFKYLMINVGTDTTTQSLRGAVYLAIVFK